MAAAAGPLLAAVRANEPAVARTWRRVMDMDFPPTRRTIFDRAPCGCARQLLPAVMRVGYSGSRFTSALPSKRASATCLDVSALCQDRTHALQQTDARGPSDCMIAYATTASLVERNETSPPSISASGRGRCCPADRLTYRMGANLSVATCAGDRSLCGRQCDGRDCPPDHPEAVRETRKTVLYREHRRCQRQHRYCQSGASATGRLHHSDCRHEP